MDFGASSSFLENISNTLDLSHNSRVSFGWVCCQTIIKGDNMICGDSNVYLCHCNILKKALFMKQFSLLFQPPRESFGQNRGCIGFLFWWRPTPEIHLHKGELHLPPSTDRHSPHILRQDMKSCLMVEMLGNDDADFIEGRRTLLEKFIRQISHFDYLLECREF